jgi:hypothetical protein
MLKLYESSTSDNSGLAKVAVQCFADTFTHCKIVFYGIREPFGVVVNQTLVLRINICGENRQLRQAANRQTV